MTVATLVLTLIGVGLTYLAVPLPNPDTHEAQRFIKRYYVTARDDPAKAWSMLSEEFRKDYRAEHDGSKVPYEVFFTGMQYIEVQQVVGIEGNSKWRAVVKYDPRRGPTYTRVHIFELKCPPRTKILRAACHDKTVRLDTSSLLEGQETE